MKVFRINSRAFLPERGTEGAVGYDLKACLPDEGQILVINPGEARAVPTGLIIALPKGFWAKIESRSGLALKSGVSVPCGVIDNDYRGEWKVVIRNHGTQKLVLEHGTKIAQFVLQEEIIDQEMLEVAELSLLGDTSRGEGGFGSTGL